MHDGATIDVGGRHPGSRQRAPPRLRSRPASPRRHQRNPGGPGLAAPARAAIVAPSRPREDTQLTTTRVTRQIAARPAEVYRALIDAEAVARWKFSAGMSIQVHEFDGREGGQVRVSLTYDGPDRAGKSTAHTDTYRGRFTELVPEERVVEVDEFETDDPAMRGPMTSTITLAGTDDGGTWLSAVHDGVPDGVPPADNELGWRLALDRLAALVEHPHR